MFLGFIIMSFFPSVNSLSRENAKSPCKAKIYKVGFFLSSSNVF